MNENIRRLCAIAQKPTRKIIGLMSGTSFDGLDIALCSFEGSGTDTKVVVEHFITKDYTADFKEEIKSVFAKRTADLERVTLLNAFIGTYYGKLILQCLQEWGVEPGEVDIVASHGQTIFHAPKHLHNQQKYGNATLQIGDADHLSVETGIITLSDFRQKHIAAGGEGAPLAVYGDFLIFASPDENRIMLNIGGIANFTFLPKDFSKGCFSTDVGPGNTLMDQYVQQQFPGKYYDKNAELAKGGKVNPALLTELLNNPFFSADFPKTTGPELFNISYLNKAIESAKVQDISIEDVLATLARFSADGIINAIERCVNGSEKFEIYLSGGGMYNPVVVRYIETHFKRKLKSTSDLGINPDAKEALLFALLANETLAGGNTNFGDDKNLPSVSMGKISFPF